MVNYVSPGVYTIEKDISDYTPSINTSIVGLLGFADKGPTTKATLITSQNQLVQTFGRPSEAIQGQAIEGALEILEQTDSLYFVRAIPAGASDASSGMKIGVCPSLVVSGGSAAAQGFGLTEALTLRIQVYDQDGAAVWTDPRDFSIPAGTAVSGQAEAIRKILGGGLDADKVGCFDNNAGYTGIGLSGVIAGSYAGSGASIGVSAASGTTFTEAAGVSALAPVLATSSQNGSFGVSGLARHYGHTTVMAGVCASAVRVYGADYLVSGAASSTSYHLQSIYEGVGYNAGTRSDGTVSGNSITVTPLGGQNFFVNVNEDGTTSESFKCSLVASGAFIEDVINTGETNLKSSILKGNLQGDDADVAVTALTNFGSNLNSLIGADAYEMYTQWLDPVANPTGAGTPVFTLTGAVAGGRWNKLIGVTAQAMQLGTNEATGTTEAQRATALIGVASTDPKTGMQLFDDDILNIGIAAVPGFHNQSVQNALITMAETTQNFLTVVSPPYAIGTTQDAIDWTNGKSSSTAGSRTAAINSSYATVYWPWVKVFSVYDSKDRWFDPAIYGIRQMCYTDAVADSWIAPAGFRRGRLTKPIDVEVILNQGDRDSLYSGGNVVNPIVKFPQQGITIFGQRTTQRSPTALDRINVRRLMIYIRKIILASTRRFVFEPNDEFTWAQIEGLLNPFMDDIKRRRGITQFRVVCDETTNTPVRVDRNELWCKVLIKPTKAAEMLIFELNITNQSADLGTL